MSITQNKEQTGLSNSAKIPGINVSYLQSILTISKVPKGVKRSLSVYKIRDFIHNRIIIWTDIDGIRCDLSDRHQ